MSKEPRPQSAKFNKISIFPSETASGTWLARCSLASHSQHSQELLIVAIVTGNANYVSHHLIPEHLNRENVRDPRSWHGAGHSTDEVEKIEIWHKPPASLSNKQREGGMGT